MNDRDSLAERFEEKLTIVNGKITEIEVNGDPARLGGLDLAVVD